MWDKAYIEDKPNYERISKHNATFFNSKLYRKCKNSGTSSKKIYKIICIGHMF